MSQLHTPRSRVCINFHVNTPKGRDILFAALGLNGEPIKVVKRDDLRVKNAARRAEVEKEAAKEGAEAQHARPGMQGDTGVQSLKDLRGVMLDEVMSDLLVRGFVVTGAKCIQEPQVDRKTGRFTDTNKLKWKVRVWFTDPTDLDPDPKGEGLHRNEALEDSLEQFLCETVCGIVHVWDDNPDGSANIEAISMHPHKEESGIVGKLRFGRVDKTADLLFYFDSFRG